MIEGKVFIATSLDGFIARTDGDIQWLIDLPAEGTDYGYATFMDGVDGLVMGRNSYEKALTLGDWPYPKPVVVMSGTLTDADLRPDLAGRVTVSAEMPAQLMRRLEAQGWSAAYVDGGKVIQSFLAEGLIAEMIITRIPVLLGAGIPLFGRLDHDIALDHVETQAFGSGLVQSHYRVRA